MLNTQNIKGYILLNNKKYDDFTPYLLNQHKNKDFIECDCFNECLNKYFNTLNNEKQLNQQNKHSKNKMGKVDKIKFNLNKRITDFYAKIKYIDEQVLFIESHLNLFESLIKNYNFYFFDYKKNNITDFCYTNFVNNFIDEDSESIMIICKYFKNTFDDFNSDIYLNDIDDKDEVLYFTFQDKKIDIQYNISIHSNIRRLYTERKKNIFKLNKTIIEGNKAIEKVEQQITPIIKPRMTFEIINKTFWFQTFNWFITSDKILFICGKNAEQNEMIVKKYMTTKDKYIHGDFYGSPSGILINNSNNEIPLQSLIQSGNFLVCNSKNWKEKITEKSYYVNQDQVSKTAPSGEYLGTGSFMIRGKKKYLPQSILEMGIGMLFVKRKYENIIDGFIVNPKDTDDIIFCLPICCPYRSLQDYKYKVKLKPGNHKKNKIIKNVLCHFSNMKSCNDKEKYLMKNISNDYFHNILLNNSYACISGFIKK